MLYLTDTETGARYKVLRWDNIRTGDNYIGFDLNNEGDLIVRHAESDYPDTMGSIILEPEPDPVCGCGKTSEGVCPRCGQNMDKN